jgi:hypothetical protein
MGFLSKTEIWEDSCNCPEDVDSRPDEIIHKVSRAFKIQTSERRSSWSGHGSFIYGNCMQQIHRPDDSLHGPDVPSLERQGNTVRTRLNSGKNFCEIWKANRIVVRSEPFCLPSGRHLGISS